MMSISANSVLIDAVSKAISTGDLAQTAAIASNKAAIDNTQAITGVTSLTLAIANNSSAIS